MKVPEEYLRASRRFGLICGEPSGDQIGASLIRAIKQRHPEASFVGIGGPLMIKEGLHTLYPMERLSIMGFFEPLKRIVELLSLQKKLKNLWLQQPPNAFIGIDAPDFNLRIEKALKKYGIPTLHYVSPTIWAWRANRIYTIKKAVDHMFLIFPFEKPIYDQHKIKATYVGLPLAKEIRLKTNRNQARLRLNIPPQEKTIALLLGSRISEIKRLAPVFIKTIQRMQEKGIRCRFIAAMLNEQLKQIFETLLKKANIQGVDLRVNQTRLILEAADCAMITSGTATLEAALHKLPHVVVYRTAWLTYHLAKRLIKTPFISMTNIVAQKALVQEYIQNINEAALVKELLRLLEGENTKEMIKEFHGIHKELLHTSGIEAAAQIIDQIAQAY